MNAPIFIVGMPRSGTTLTAKILGAHSRIFMPGETHFFDDIYARRYELGSLAQFAAAGPIIERLSTIYERYNEAKDQERIAAIFKDPHIVDDFKFRCKSYREVYSWFMEVQMRNEGKARWGNHVPRDIFNTSEILKFYPDAKFVVCLRDVKDFLVSYKNKWQTATLDSNQKRLQAIYHPVVTSVLWKTTMTHISQLLCQVPEQNRIVIPYEKMVQAPETIIRAICNCIGERFEPSMMAIDFSNSSFNRGQAGIFQTSIGRWHANLTAEEVALAQKICSRELHNIGYDIVAVQYSMVKLISILIRTPIALIKGMRANKNLRGSSTLMYLFKRLLSL